MAQAQSSVEVHVSSQHSLFIIPVSPHELPHALPGMAAHPGRGGILPGAALLCPRWQLRHLPPPPMELAQVREKRKEKEEGGKRGGGEGRRGKGKESMTGEKALPFFLSRVICTPGVTIAQCLKQAE